MMSLLLLPLALGQDLPPGECLPASSTLADTTLLRAWSLDLRGTLPTADELEAVVAGEPVETFLDRWLETEDFADQVVRHHRSLLWPNVSDIRLLSNRQRLIQDGDVYWRYLVAPHYRGGPISCGDFPAETDADGNLIVVEDANGWIQEGWVTVNPYWAPDTEVKVCAFEAQEDLISPLGTVCNTYDSRYDQYCGCGPNLRWCDTRPLGHVQENGYQAPVHRSMARDAELRVKRMVEADLPYTEILTSRTAFVNGPLVHFYRHNLHTPAHVRFNEVPVDPELLPDLDFTDEDTWVEVELGPEQSGILTAPVYLMKYQTRRARANRFYNAFVCQPFQPPDGGVPGVENPDASLDLSTRDGCKYCHAILEPAGAHWARWSEYGAGYLDPARFPIRSDDCHWCASTGESCSTECREFYVVDPLTSEQDPYIGALRSYEFLEERHHENATLGPTHLVNTVVADGRLPRCVATNTAQWLLGRNVDRRDGPWIDGLADGFRRDGLDYKALVRAIVTSENYRRLR
jgi:NAD-dependent dihydropyrimidine dehydrogenase PreA subunit